MIKIQHYACEKRQFRTVAISDVRMGSWNFQSASVCVCVRYTAVLQSLIRSLSVSAEYEIHRGSTELP